MKKYTTSLAVLAALFMTGTQAKASIPVLSGHLEETP
jgi:hypothetical protein